MNSYNYSIPYRGDYSIPFRGLIDQELADVSGEYFVELNWDQQVQASNIKTYFEPGFLEKINWALDWRGTDYDTFNIVSFKILTAKKFKRVKDFTKLSSNVGRVVMENGIFTHLYLQKTARTILKLRNITHVLYHYDKSYILDLKFVVEDDAAYYKRNKAMAIKLGWTLEFPDPKS